MDESADGVTETTCLDVLCAPEGGAWRTYVAPQWVPAYLRRYLDHWLEIFPVQLDFDDLDRQMREQGAVLEKRTSKNGSTQLVARGQSAQALAKWLAGAFATAPAASSGTSTTAGATDSGHMHELLLKLRDGKISREEFVDMSAEHSLDHLRRWLSASKLQILRETIREAMETDPVLIKLTADALEQLPKLPPEKL